MSDKPETLSAILAEMRDERIVRLDGADVTRCLLLNLADRIEAAADRIEAAAERERAELRRQLRNEIEINNALATVRPQFNYVDDVFAEAERERAHEIELAKLRAPGNASALREALERSTRRLAGVVSELPLEMQKYVNADIRDNDAALAAPARNCDRPECKTEEGASATYIAEHPHAVEPDASTYGSWLLATAEGGVK